MSSIEKDVGKGFSMLKNTFMSGLASASSLASGTMSMNSSRHSKSPFDEDLLSLVHDLGMNDLRIAERDAIFEDFHVIVGKTNHDNEASVGITIERFVIDMLKRGFSPQWSDAAFRAFDTKKNNYLNRYEYLLAVSALRISKEVYENATWIKLRRRVLFAYYDRNNTHSLDINLFSELLSDMSVSAEDAETFGVTNKAWRRNQLTNTKQTSENSIEDVSQVSIS